MIKNFLPYGEPRSPTSDQIRLWAAPCCGPWSTGGKYVPMRARLIKSLDRAVFKKGSGGMRPSG